MPPKHHHHHNHHPDAAQQQQSPAEPPSVGDWIGGMLLTGSKQQGGPFAMGLVNHPFGGDQIADMTLSRLQTQVEQLPQNMPNVFFQQVRGTPLAQQPQSLQALYTILRFFLQAVLTHSRPSKDAPRNRLEAMLNAYSTFEAFHKEERGSGEAGSLLPVPGATTTANVGWDTAILVVLCQKIRALAQVEDALDEGLLSDLIRKWRSMFLFLVSCDKGIANNVARRRGALVVLNCLLAVLLHLGNLHQVKAILQTVDQLEASSGGDPSKGVFVPCGHIKSEVTKIFYYQARVKLYLGNESQSFALFSQVCERMPPLLSPSASSAGSLQQQAAPNGGKDSKMIADVRRNKMRGVFYLCCSAIICGIVPDIQQLLANSDKFMFSIFDPIISAINNGSPTKFQQALDDASNTSHNIGAILRTRGVYLQLKQMYLMTIFVAVRRAHSILAELGQDNSRIDIACISKVSKALDRHAVGNNNNNNNKDGEQQQQQDLTLIVDLGQMIQLGWIKGYISFEHQILVLSKKEPFPRRA